MNIEELNIENDFLSLLSVDQAWSYQVVPYRDSDIFISKNNENNSLKHELEIILGRELNFILIEELDLIYLLNKFYKKDIVSSVSRLNYNTSSDDFLQKLILEAKQINSSDIHIEKYEQNARVRLRIDGLLVERFVIDLKEYPSIINRIKIMSSLDISEKRLPQDGRIFYSFNNNKFDIRVSCLPTLFGEKIVLRLLNQDSTNIQIDSLGLSPVDLSNYLESTKLKQGLILISGPTGSGKTTTLYATLKVLNQISRNILTIEDPVEYTLEGVNQAQLKESIGFNFSNALKTFLRQDPDVIMVGEIRDYDTANMAIRLSLTGHLVLSTIHTNSAWGTVARLIDMGVPSFLLANTLSVSVAQRLVRILCNQCKQKKTFDNKSYPRNFTASRNVEICFEAKGCEHCYHTGYKGRKAVYEVIPIDIELSHCIKNKEFEIDELLKQRGIKTIADNAFELFYQGLTSIDEIYPLLIKN